ncbi:MAG: glutathione S-transferase family protein [Alphaproteobacteria bacterium]
MLELYHNDMSVCAQKVRIALAEKQLDWQSHHLNLRAGDAQKPEYLKLNQNAVVPTLVHDGNVVTESTVICEYLDDAFRDRPLSPASPFGRAQMRLWTKQLDEDLHGAVGTLSLCIAFRFQFLKRTPEQMRAYMARIPQPHVRERRRLAIEHGMDAPTFEPALRRWAKMLADAEQSLTTARWLAGDTFSLADVGYASYMIRLEHLGLERLWRDYPRVADWRLRLFERQSFKDGIGKWLNADYLALMEAQRAGARAFTDRLLDTPAASA